MGCTPFDAFNVLLHQGSLLERAVAIQQTPHSAGLMVGFRKMRFSLKSLHDSQPRLRSAIECQSLQVGHQHTLCEIHRQE